MADPGEGPSIPRYHLARSTVSHRTRLSLVNDIEEIDSNSYIPSPRPLSAGSSVESTGLQWTPPASPSSRASHSRSHSFNSLNVPPHYIHRRASSPQLHEDAEEEDDEQIGQISIVRPVVRRPNSVHTASSYGALDGAMSSTRSTSPNILPIQQMDAAPPPPVPTINLGKARDHRPDPIETIRRPQQHMMRSLSAHTASSYAMYTPRSPASSKQVRFSAMSPGQGDVPPLPPHALDALAQARIQQEQQARFFHGPPPLHGDDVLPPPYKGKALGTDDNQGGTEDEKGFTADGVTPDTRPWWRRRGKLFWALLAIGIIVIVFGAVVGAVVGLKVHKNNQSNNNVVVSSNGTTSTFPPPKGFLGTWAFTTNLTSQDTACAPAPSNATQDLWRCYPYQTPPSTETVTWSFVILDQDDSTATASDPSVSDNIQLLIQSTSNPFTHDFSSQPLNLTRTLTNAYYGFSFNYTKTTLVAFGNSVAECEFPNSVFSGQLFVNNSIFSTTNAQFSPSQKRVQTDARGQWPGNIVLHEEKIQGARQVLCRDRATQNVLNLGDVTTGHGDGNCLCGYTNF